MNEKDKDIENKLRDLLDEVDVDIKDLDNIKKAFSKICEDVEINRITKNKVYLITTDKRKNCKLIGFTNKYYVYYISKKKASNGIVLEDVNKVIDFLLKGVEDGK